LQKFPLEYFSCFELSVSFEFSLSFEYLGSPFLSPDPPPVPEHDSRTIGLGIHHEDRYYHRVIVLPGDDSDYSIISHEVREVFMGIFTKKILTIPNNIPITSQG
jgi:hypothetical protein